MPKGRDKELIKKRDEALCRRYYYWTETQGLRFDRALKILSEQEFFISEERIMAVIRERSKIDPDIQPVPKVRAPRPCFQTMPVILSGRFIVIVEGKHLFIDLYVSGQIVVPALDTF